MIISSSSSSSSSSSVWSNNHFNNLPFGISLDIKQIKLQVSNALGNWMSIPIWSCWNIGCWNDSKTNKKSFNVIHTTPGHSTPERSLGRNASSGAYATSALPPHLSIIINVRLGLYDSLGIVRVNSRLPWFRHFLFIHVLRVCTEPCSNARTLHLSISVRKNSMVTAFKGGTLCARDICGNRTLARIRAIASKELLRFAETYAEDTRGRNASRHTSFVYHPEPTAMRHDTTSG